MTKRNAGATKPNAFVTNLSDRAIPQGKGCRKTKDLITLFPGYEEATRIHEVFNGGNNSNSIRILLGVVMTKKFQPNQEEDDAANSYENDPSGFHA